MGDIRVLSFEIANLIAAGEVVERPSSVLKELIENAIDAGGRHIVAEIKRGGVALIRVSDDGCGMEREDLPVALQRHATSKIRDRSDLEHIGTLGFRGEALAAISSVSRVTIISKTASSPIGSMLTAEGGQVVDVSEVGAADGTTVVVEDLFYNVPARRKFLKKDATEAMNVAALVERVALSHPEISIQLLSDGEERFRTPGDGDVRATLRAVYGRDFASRLIAVDGTADRIRVHGYVGRSDNVRKNRNLENFFINGRYVKSLTAQAALEKAFTSYIAPEAFPTCALFLEMNLAEVDVNVHPAKLEVKFSDERRVFEAVYYSVRTALEREAYRPELTLTGTGEGRSRGSGERNPLGAFLPIGAEGGEQLRYRTAATPAAPPAAPARAATAPQPPATVRGTTAPGRDAALDRTVLVGSGVGQLATDELTARESLSLLERYRTAQPTEPPVTATPVTVPEPSAAVGCAAPATQDAGASAADGDVVYRYVGEAFDCYVIVEYEGDLLLIDKHAAHERVIFEQLRTSRAQGGRVASQALLLPITALLSAESAAAVAEYTAELEAVGFSFTLREGAADITAIPDAISVADAETLFVQMADELAQGRGNPAVTEQLRRERALYQVACKAAIKGGRSYDRTVIDWLIRRLLTIPDITVCPHGRPVAYRLTKNELDRKFDRLK